MSWAREQAEYAKSQDVIAMLKDLRKKPLTDDRVLEIATEWGRCLNPSGSFLNSLAGDPNPVDNNHRKRCVAFFTQCLRAVRTRPQEDVWESVDMAELHVLIDWFKRAPLRFL